MKTLKFIDMTLRQAGPSFGKVLSFKEKLEIARSLDRLRADTIELAPISGSKPWGMVPNSSCTSRSKFKRAF